MMALTYWHKQTSDDPLFPDLLWSRPENKQQAGKLLIIGGNLHGFSAPARVYSEARKAGIGSARVLLPDALKKTVGTMIENGEFAPSTPSGSFSRSALASWLDWSQWSDGVVLAGDLGRNSETAIAIETFAKKYQGLLTITKDAVDYFYNDAKALTERSNTTVVLSLAQLQKLCVRAKWPKPITYGMDLLQLIDAAHELSQVWACNIVTYHHKNIVVASDGQVSTTSIGDTDVWRADYASRIAVWWLQLPQKPFESITTACANAT